MKQPASHIKRFLAFWIDILISVVLLFLLVVKVAESNTLSTFLDNLFTSIMILLLCPLLLQLFQAYMTFKYGGSIGKLICGLQVVNKDNKNISLPLSVFRAFISPIISGTVIYAGYFWILKDPERRGWHDLALGTRVIERNKNGLLYGGVTFITLFIAATYFSFMSLQLFSLHQNMYKDVIQDVTEELTKPSPTPVRNLNLPET